MVARVRWVSILAVLHFGVSAAWAQVGDSPDLFEPPCLEPCFSQLVARQVAAYPAVPTISVAQGSATLILASPGDFSQPWSINESISGAAVTLQIVGGFLGTILSQFSSTFFGTPQQFVLTATNTGPHPWSAFEIELQSVLGQPSGDLDGLSFGDPQNLNPFPPPSSTKFAILQSETVDRDALLFTGGIVNPGESVMFRFIIMQRNRRFTLPASFYIVQRPVLVVKTDLKPKDDPNCVNPASRRSVPVAIFGGATFGVSSINPSTLRFGAAPPLSCEIDNVPMEGPALVFNKKDGFPDLVCYFSTALVAWPRPGTNCGVVPLAGSLNDGTLIFGIDTACLASETTCSTGTPTFGDNPLRVMDIPPPIDYLTFSQDPLPFTISAPGFTAGPAAVTVSSATALSISSISIPFISTSNGTAWLTASVSGSNTLNMSIANTSALALGAPYTGTVTVRANGNPATDSVLNVTLQVGSTSGVVANPPSWSPIGRAVGRHQTFTVTNNEGFVVPVIGNFVGFPFVNVQSNANGTVTLTINGAATAKGVYSGRLDLINIFFPIVSVPVSLTIP